MQDSTSALSTPSFITGKFPENPGLLARYLPPLPDGVVASWLAAHSEPGDWILDPFGSAPRSAAEAARAGYRILVAANNPIAKSLISLEADPPQQADLRSALADLAAAHRGEERMEPHIRSLYYTDCINCGQLIMADYFIWERQAAGPSARFYTCPHCGDSGERPASNEDKERAFRYANNSLHRARALERVVAPGDPDRHHVEEALEVYLPRAVYALFTMINKLDALQITPEARNLLQALILYACDQGSALWHHPAIRERPRQLAVPPRFRENNIWLALEQGVNLFNNPMPAVPCTIWPELPPQSGGICIFEGRLKDWAAELSKINIGAIVSGLPRPNQAFWTLSALWSGWLWGKEAAGPFKSVLRRRRYDWGWHTTALQSALSTLFPIIKTNTPFLGMIGEAEPGFVSAALVAAETAGFDLDGVALRLENNQAQITWRRAKLITEERVSIDRARQIAVQGCTQLIKRCGKPVVYLPVCSAALESMAQAHTFQLTPKVSEYKPTVEPATEPTPAQNFTLIQAVIKDALNFRNGFLRLEGSEQSIEVGHWWLRDEEGCQMSLDDRLETAVVRYLLKNPELDLDELDRKMCAEFTGFLTPDREFIQICLESYGDPDSENSERWHIRDHDIPASRRSDLEEMKGLLLGLGEKLGFKFMPAPPPEGELPAQPSLIHLPYYWYDKNGSIQYMFYILASACISEIVFHSQVPVPPGLKFTGAESINRVIVLPGSRANLVTYKMHTDPRLRQAVDQDWRFIKFRHLRHLVENPLISLDILNDQLALDPLTHLTTQHRLI